VSSVSVLGEESTKSQRTFVSSFVDPSLHPRRYVARSAWCDGRTRESVRPRNSPRRIPPVRAAVRQEMRESAKPLTTMTRSTLAPRPCTSTPVCRMMTTWSRAPTCTLQTLIARNSPKHKCSKIQVPTAHFLGKAIILQSKPPSVVVRALRRRLPVGRQRRQFVRSQLTQDQAVHGPKSKVRGRTCGRTMMALARRATLRGC
jgi:hypothetical protein